MSITQTQVFLANISNLRPGEGLGLRIGYAGSYVSKCSRERPGSVQLT